MFSFQILNLYLDFIISINNESSIRKERNKKKKTLKVAYSTAFILERVSVDPEKASEDLKIIH